MAVKYTKNAFAARAELQTQSHTIGVFRAQGTCVVAASVILPLGVANSASQMP